MNWIVFNPRKLIVLASAVLMWWMPHLVFAVPTFSEVMYDLQNGADSGREWIEVQNIGDSIDLKSFKLFEDGINHEIKFIRGKSSLGVGEFAVIVSDSNKFLLDHPNFSGNLFDSSFSLLNTGEILSLRDAKLVTVDSLTYSSTQGGAGDGDSLQINDGGLWTPGIPTPGLSNVITSRTLPIQRSEVGKVSQSTTLTPKPPVKQASLDESVKLVAQGNHEAGGQVIPKDTLQKSNVTSVANQASTGPVSAQGVALVWLIWLGVLIGVAIVGFLVVNNYGKEKEKELDEADTYEIIES